jgi:hypothetical protein
METSDFLLSETFGYVFARILYQPHPRINQRHTFAAGCTSTGFKSISAMRGPASANARELEQQLLQRRDISRRRATLASEQARSACLLNHSFDSATHLWQETE